MITDLLFRLGVGTWVQDFITDFPVTGKNSIPIGKDFPTDIGFIYGFSTYADGVDAANDTLPTTTECENIFLNLQDGATTFYENKRLSDFLLVYAGSPIVRPYDFIPVQIPRFDLSKSSYNNPLLLTNLTVHLKVHYIQSSDWSNLKEEFKFGNYQEMGTKK